MTAWSGHKAVIRRFLRDPDSNIWEDDYLLNIWNAEQHSVQNEFGLLQKSRVVRIPGTFETAYLHDWEWTHTDHSDGDVYQCFALDDATDYVFTHIWEPQHLEGLTPTSTPLGENYTQPWEAWIADAPAEPPPTPLPSAFYRMQFAAWDKDPISPISLKELQDRDQSYRSRSGKPMHYYRHSELENWIYLYPRVSSVTWDDSDERSGDPDSAEYGSTTLDVDDNLLVVYDYEATDLAADSSESDFPEFVRKFVMHGVLARAYGANTDGRIRSLSDYWAMRRRVDRQIIEAYRSKRRIDRDYCLRTKSQDVNRRIRKHPRLPDEYPAVNP